MTPDAAARTAREIVLDICKCRPRFTRALSECDDCMTKRIAAALVEARAERDREWQAVVTLYKEYVTFLNEANNGPVALAFVHGWRCPEADVAKGKDYRKRIDAALRAVQGGE